MLELLGTACVGWTLIELIRLGSSPARAERGGTPPPASARPSRRSAAGDAARRWRAWDEHGNRIVVEDLGTR